MNWRRKRPDKDEKTAHKVEMLRQHATLEDFLTGAKQVFLVKHALEQGGQVLTLLKVLTVSRMARTSRLSNTREREEKRLVSLLEKLSDPAFASIPLTPEGLNQVEVLAKDRVNTFFHESFLHSKEFDSFAAEALSCGVDTDIEEVNLLFPCKFAPTDPRNLHCDACSTTVHEVSTLEEVRKHAKQGHCLKIVHPDLPLLNAMRTKNRRGLKLGLE